MRKTGGGKSKSKGAQLRRLMKRGCVAMPGAFNAITARLIEQIGFEAVYVSGAGLSNAAAGVPDIGLLSRSDVRQLSGWVAKAVSVPVVVDADTGWGGPDGVAKTVAEFEHAGLAGLHMEDQVPDKKCGHLSGKKLISASAMSSKLKAAAGAKRDKDFLLIARTDARSVEGFDAAVKRAEAYLDAGADAIFPEAMESEDEFAEFARRVKAPLLANMTEFGKSPLLSLQRLDELGYRLAIFPQTAFRIAMKAEEQCLMELKKDGSQRGCLDRMQTRKELYALLQYDPLATSWPTGK
jgi:methylisocitrate lyase